MEILKISYKYGIYVFLKIIAKIKNSKVKIELKFKIKSVKRELKPLL